MIKLCTVFLTRPSCARASCCPSTAPAYWTAGSPTAPSPAKAGFFSALEFCRPGCRLSDIGHAVQTYAESQGYGVVRDLCGHGIGTDMHEDPNVPNYGRPGRGVKLQAGMTITIEPMIAQGTWKVYCEDNDWTIVTRDGGLASHYEHTLLITDGEPELLSYPGMKVSEVLR